MIRRVRSSAKADPAAASTNREIELKLRVPPARFRALMASPLLRGNGATQTVVLAATYYDTPGLDLWRARIALRVRREGRRWVQAVKGGGTVESGLHTRHEFETVLPGPSPDFSVLPRNPLTRILRSPKISRAVVPVLTTSIRRSLRLLTPAPGVLIEVAMDRGEIRSGHRRESICELELELKRGPVSALFDLALALAATQALELEQHSKAERGYALFQPQLARPLKASAVRLDARMDAGDAFREIVASTLQQVQGNARGVLESGDPEYLHQMRVGLRRLRSALDLFRHELGDSLAAPAATLRSISSGLGAARDWDVLVVETLPHFSEVPQMAVLTSACARLRQSARKNAKNIIKTNGYIDSMLVLGRAFATPELTAAADWHEPACDAAARILNERHAKVLKRGRRLRGHTPAELHRLRIAVKKLRYATEFFNDLFQVKAMATQRARLEKLQDILGSINDAAAVQPLLDSARAGARRWPAAAAKVVIEWHEQRAARQRKRLAAAWRQFCDAPQPWRH